MSRMIFDLTDEDKALLEAFRALRGLRSLAEALRTLIREGVTDLRRDPALQFRLSEGLKGIERAKERLVVERAAYGSRLKKR